MIPFDNTFAREMQGFYVPCAPARVPAPRTLWWNAALAAELAIDVAEEDVARTFSGNEMPEGASPLAQVYAGHQFGGFAPQLGDGRAHLLGEVEDRAGRRRDIALKGSGRTLFSRGGDGKAAVGPVLREVLVAEAMHALGVPTTRALAAVRTGETVHREEPLPGAVLTRVAASHLRVGTFEFFAARGEHDKVARLVDYVVARHDPQLADESDRALRLLAAVAERQAALVARWMLVGFLHGVMNTDNMALSGETIDFGPCAFLDAYDPSAVFSSIDVGGRYAFGNQPNVALWNLGRFAETLLPQIDPQSKERAIELATEVLQAFPARYAEHWLDGARAKLGLATARADDAELAHDWLALLRAQEVDWTSSWRRLSDAAGGDAEPVRSLFRERAAFDAWCARWTTRLATEPERSPATRAAAMRRVNPVYVPRNREVEAALSAASERDDLAPFERLLAAVTRPFEERPEFADLAQPAPREFTACYRTFCGT